MGFPVTETCSEFREAVENIIPGEPFAENFGRDILLKKKWSHYFFSSCPMYVCNSSTFEIH